MDRTERSRLLADDRGRIAGGIASATQPQELVIALMRVLRDRLDSSIAAGSVAPVMAFLYDNMALTEAAAAPRDVVACRRGCAHCCHGWVSASAPEVLFAVSQIRGAARDALAGAVEAANTRTRQLDFQARDALALACPFLEANQCGAYAHRPVACRTAMSTDAQRCERAYIGRSGEDIPVPRFYLTLRTGYSLALRGALLDAGLPDPMYEYNAALAVALGRADAEAAWLGGEDIFAGVQRDPSPSPFGRELGAGLYRRAFA